MMYIDIIEVMFMILAIVLVWIFIFGALGFMIVVAYMAMTDETREYRREYRQALKVRNIELQLKKRAEALVKDLEVDLDKPLKPEDE